MSSFSRDLKGDTGWIGQRLEGHEVSIFDEEGDKGAAEICWKDKQVGPGRSGWGKEGRNWMNEMRGPSTHAQQDDKAHRQTGRRTAITVRLPEICIDRWPSGQHMRAGHTHDSGAISHRTPTPTHTQT